MLIVLLIERNCTGCGRLYDWCAGLFQMSCVKHDRVSAEVLVIPVVLAVVVCYASWMLFAYWPRLRREWNNLRAEALKRRSAHNHFHK